MVSIKKIFGSSNHDESATDGGDLRNAPTGSQGRTSGHEGDAKKKNDELARSLNSGDNDSSSNTSNTNRNSSSNVPGLVGTNEARNSTTSNRDSATGYNTEATGEHLPKTMGAYNEPGVGPTPGLVPGAETHATNANAKGVHNKGLDNIGSHRGLVGEHPESTDGALNGDRPVVQVVEREAVPGTAKSASDHILHTRTGHVHDNDIGSTTGDATRSAPVVAAVPTEKSGHGRLSSSSSGRGFGDGPHETGHVASKEHHEFDPKLATHDHQHLQHVTHRQVRHVEVEEVERQREVDRHIHHVQTHVQPVLDKQVLPEKLSENIIAPTKVNEVHASTPEDVKLFESLATQHRDTESHRPKERTVVDLGEKVNEKVHHHVHHVTQPIIEQEVVERHRIHTVIPVHHVTHEAPIIHKSSTHAPVSLNDFLQGGGKLDSHVTHETSGLLDNDDCERVVDGPAESLIKDLNLGGSTFGHSHTGSSHSHTGSSSSGKLGQVAHDLHVPGSKTHNQV